MLPTLSTTAILGILIMGAWISKPGDSGAVSTTSTPSALFQRTGTTPPTVLSVKDNWMYLDDGSAVYDASGGPVVSSLGHGYRERIMSAMINQYMTVDYVPLNFDTEITKALSLALIDTTEGLFSKVLFYNSGKSIIKSL
jgi:adenosylmethionine-8-amino-7-oxononanoate aminotransferase